MKIQVQPINPAFMKYAMRYIEEIEEYTYTFVGTEGYGNATYVFEVDEDDPYKAIPPVIEALHRPPIGAIMFCNVAPYGALHWPPY